MLQIIKIRPFIKQKIENTTILLANLILQAIYIIYRIYDHLAYEPLLYQPIELFLIAIPLEELQE